MRAIQNFTKVSIVLKERLGLGYARHHKQGTRKSLLLTHQAHIVADMVASVVLTLVERIHLPSSAQPWP